MSAPVWVLSVDLQTKTATFTTGLADAAQKARGSFKEIGDGAKEGMDGVRSGTSNVRAALGLLDNTIRGNHAAAMADMIREFKDTAFVMGAIPFAAFTGGLLLAAGIIVEIAEKVRAWREEQEKLRDVQTEFETASNKALGTLDEKLLTAGIHADELNRNHLAALKLQLELIDRQTMSDLVRSFDEISKASDSVFAQLKSNWYSLGIGSDGAKHALNEFKIQYDALLAQGKDKEAADLLSGTRKSAEQTLSALQAVAKGSGVSTERFSADDAQKINAYEAARNELKKDGLSGTKTEIQAQEQLIATLDAQAEAQKKVNALKDLQGGNASRTAQNAIGAEAEARFKQEAEAAQRGAEIEQKAWEEAHRAAVQSLQQSERQKIEITDKGSAERLAAINDAIKEENKYGLQETSFYLELLNQRLTTAKEMEDEADKQKAAAAKEAADQAVRMGQLELAAEQEKQHLIDSAHRITIEHRIAEEIDAANALEKIKQTGFADEIAALDKHDKEYETKLKVLQDKQKLAEKQHQDELTKIKDQAAIQQNAHALAAITQTEQLFARGFANVITGHQSFASAMASIENQILTGMIQSAIMDLLTLDMDRERSAAKAARHAFTWGWEHGGPAAPVLAPTLGALAFASVMAFDKGGIVPGPGKGDVVPAMLTPGEAVLNKRLTEGLTRVADSGNMGGPQRVVHIHVRPTYNVNTIDGDGMQAALEEHSQILSAHVESTFRRMNK